MRSDQSNMERIKVSLGLFAPPFVTTPHGQFRLSNPTAFRPGRAHVIEYFPLDQWARIIETADAPSEPAVYRVADPGHVNPIHAVEVLAEDAEQAKRLALAAMMVRSLEDLDEKVVQERLAYLTIEAVQEDYRDPVVQARLLEAGTRKEIIAWLTWNDPNGVWIGEDSEDEGWQPITLEAARSVMREALSEASNNE